MRFVPAKLARARQSSEQNVGRRTVLPASATGARAMRLLELYADCLKATIGRYSELRSEMLH